jgi:molybdopterin/thiamine biosynthesis adenylyltransferase
MLRDDQIDRYARQILLPEVGPRGQRGLLAARVAVAGADDAARWAVTLLGRAGLGALDLVDGPVHLPELTPDCHVARHDVPTALPPADAYLDLADDDRLAARASAAGGPLVRGAAGGGRAAVVVLVGHPCARCLPPGTLPPRVGTTDPPLSLALGALAALETLRAIWTPPGAGRLHALGLDGARSGAVALAATSGCARCGDRG